MFQRTYLSREMTRVMALDHPIGDPFGGAAYGEKNGPVAALAAAFFTVEVGITIGINTIVGGLMVAGGVMSGLGAITGNESLSKLGMVASLAGGIAGIADIGGAFAEAGTTFADQAAGAFSDDKGLSSLWSGGGEAAGTGISATPTPAATGAPAPAEGGLINSGATAAPSTTFTSPFDAGKSTSDFFGIKAGQGADAVLNTKNFTAGDPSSSGLLGSIKEAWSGADSSTKLMVGQGAMNTLGGVAQGVMNYPQQQAELEMMQRKLDNDTSMTDIQRQLAQAKLDAEKRRVENMKSQNYAGLIPTTSPTYASNINRNGATIGVA